MSVSELTSAAQDYLKVIWSATEWSATPITVTKLAERMGVRAATVSDGIRRLTEQGMLVHAPYGSIELTDVGRRHAVAMVRRHRLLETFLVEVLGYGWDEVHDEAEVLEHAVSDALVDRIDERLGFPTRDPHGDPIPSPDGRAGVPEAVRLSDAPVGAALVVARISDADPAILRRLADLGIALDVRLSVEARAPGAVPPPGSAAGPEPGAVPPPGSAAGPEPGAVPTPGSAAGREPAGDWELVQVRVLGLRDPAGADASGADAGAAHAGCADGGDRPQSAPPTKVELDPASAAAVWVSLA